MEAAPWNDDWIVILAGAALLAGYVAHVVGRRAHVPRVSILLAIGAAVGPAFLDIVPHSTERLFPVVTQAALSMVGFVLGKHFTRKTLRETGRLVLTVSFVQSVVTLLFVLALLLAAGVPLVMSCLLAAVAPATAPAAVLDVTRELHADGPLTRCTLDVVAIDDAWAVLLFSIMAALAGALGGNGEGVGILARGFLEVGGAVMLGVVIGLPMAWLTGRLVPGELTWAETLGFVLLAGGAASQLDVSYLITCMTMGVVVANRAVHHERAFHAVENALEPFLIAFFLLAGFEFRLDGLLAMSVPGILYIVARTAGKVSGSWLGTRLGGAPPVVRRYLGWALLPQAGVALGLGLLLAERFPEMGALVLQMLIGTTVVFEIFGPVCTRASIVLAGESRRETVA